MSLRIFGANVAVTVIDMKSKRFVVDIQKVIKGNLIIGMTIQTNKSLESKVDIQVEIYEGIPF